MVGKKDFNEVEPIDLSVGSRGRRKGYVSGGQLVQIAKADESRELATSVFSTLTAGSPLKSPVYVSDRVASLLDSYGDLQSSKFLGLISLILDTAKDSLYEEAFDNVFASLVNVYLDHHGLDLAKRWNMTYVEGTRAFWHLREVMSSFSDFPSFVFEDAGSSNFGDNSPVGRFVNALDLTGRLESAKDEVLDLQGKLEKFKVQVGRLEREKHDLQGLLDSERSVSASRISDLEGLNASLKVRFDSDLAVERRRFENFRYYYFAVPRVLRLFKRWFSGRLFGVRDRFHR